MFERSEIIIFFLLFSFLEKWTRVGGVAEFRQQCISRDSRATARRLFPVTLPGHFLMLICFPRENRLGDTKYLVDSNFIDFFFVIFIVGTSGQSQETR